MNNILNLYIFLINSLFGQLTKELMDNVDKYLLSNVFKLFFLHVPVRSKVLMLIVRKYLTFIFRINFSRFTFCSQQNKVRNNLNFTMRNISNINLHFFSF